MCAPLTKKGAYLFSYSAEPSAIKTEQAQTRGMKREPQETAPKKNASSHVQQYISISSITKMNRGPPKKGKKRKESRHA